MIKLFRNIRQKLIEQGKTSNYLKYAIGEIVLVVINNTVLCPVRDNLLVARNNTKSNPRAFRPACRTGRYDIYNVPNDTLNQRNTYLLPI